LQADVSGLGEFAPLHEFARYQGFELRRRATDQIDAIALRPFDEVGCVRGF
jgi:hypothetical protein